MTAKRKRKPSALTHTMIAALDDITKWGGSTVRWAGGYWTFKGCPASNGTPDQHHGTPTIEALVRRGYLVYTAWKAGRHERFPIQAKLVPQE